MSSLFELESLSPTHKPHESNFFTFLRIHLPSISGFFSLYAPTFPLVDLRVCFCCEQPSLSSSIIATKICCSFDVSEVSFYLPQLAGKVVPDDDDDDDEQTHNIVQNDHP
ncbi:hypothetical protein ACFE04_001537 [Oxalis oulophora]